MFWHPWHLSINRNMDVVRDVQWCAIDHSRKYHNILLFVCHPKFCKSIAFSFSWELKWPQENLKTMFMQNFGVTNKEHYGMLWCFLEWSISGCTWAPKLARKCETKHRFPCGADGRTVGGQSSVTWLPNFLGWVDLLSYGAPPTRARGAPLSITPKEMFLLEPEKQTSKASIFTKWNLMHDDFTCVFSIPVKFEFFLIGLP